MAADANRVGLADMATTMSSSPSPMPVYFDQHYDSTSNSDAPTLPSSSAAAFFGPGSSSYNTKAASPFAPSPFVPSPPPIPRASSLSPSLDSSAMVDGIGDGLRGVSLTSQHVYPPPPPRDSLPPSYLPQRAVALASAPSFGRPINPPLPYAPGTNSISPSLIVSSPPDPMMSGTSMSISSRSLGGISGGIPTSMTPSIVAPPPPVTGNGYFTPVPGPVIGSVTERQLTEDDSASATTPFVLFSSQTVPNQKKIANIGSLPFGAFISPITEVDSSRPPVLSRDPVRCEMCGAHVNLYCKVVPRIGQWTCVFCSHANSSSGNYSVDDFGSWPELLVKTVDYVVPNRQQLEYPIGAAVSPASSVVLVIDENLTNPYLQELQNSLIGALEIMDDSTRFGIITFGATVSVYDLSEPGIASADVLPGNASPGEEAIKMLLYGSGNFLTPMHSCAPVAHTVLSSLRPYRRKLAESERRRCLGTAVEVAIALIRGVAGEEGGISRSEVMSLSRIIVCANGPPNFGPGAAPAKDHPNYAYEEKNAMEYMEELGNEAKRLNVAVDVFCGGTCPVNVPVLHLLAKASGGLLWLHEDFGETFGTNVRKALTRACGSDGILEVRCSGPVTVNRIIGPAEAIDDLIEESYPEDIVTTCRMLSVEANHGFAVCMELLEDVPQDYVHFQFVARYTNLQQARVVRVITLRLPTTGNTSTYLKSVDEDVAAVLIAKRTAVEAVTAADAADMRLSIDERLKDIAENFGSRMDRSKLRKFPSELPRLPEMLLHLRRGPLLGSIIGHEDERGVLRNTFLQASYDMSLRMVVPRLLSYVNGGTFEEVPAVDLALQSESSLVLDHGSDVFIWMGLDVVANDSKNAASLAACKALVREAVGGRFPSPRVAVCKEAGSRARFILSRLVPAHKDPPYEQEAWFPQLRTLRPEQRAKLKAKFFHTDDLSFFEYMKGLKLMPPEISAGFR